MIEVSVLMSTYNERENEIKEAIDSILNQTYSNFEFIIMLDKPDNIVIEQILNMYEQIDHRVKLYVNEKNLGLPDSLNKALDLSKGKYIARMDADDVSLDFRLEKQYKYLLDNSLDLVGTNYRLMSQDGNKEYEAIKHPTNPEDICRNLKVDNISCVGHPTWFARREVFEKLQGYRNIHTCEDYDFLLRACKLGFRIGNVDDICLIYRLTTNSLSRNNRIKQGLVSRFLRDHYEQLFRINAKDIEAYLDSRLGKNDAKIYKRHLELCDELQQCKRSKRWGSYILCAIKVIFYSKHGREELRRKIKQKTSKK